MPDGSFKDVSLAQYKGKFVILCFYPLDWTFVCPSELIAFSDRIKEFQVKKHRKKDAVRVTEKHQALVRTQIFSSLTPSGKAHKPNIHRLNSKTHPLSPPLPYQDINAEVLGISVDSKYSHLAWSKSPRKAGGLGGLSFPLISDLTKELSCTYGVLIPEEGVALRGLFIIDPKGVLRQITINDLPIGRDVDETLRLVQVGGWVGGWVFLYFLPSCVSHATHTPTHRPSTLRISTGKCALRGGSPGSGR